MLRAALGVLALSAALWALAGTGGDATTALGAGEPRYSARERAVIRRALLRTLKRDPSAIRRPSFIRKAVLTEFRLPITIRLNQVTNQTPATRPTDDEIGIDLTTERSALGAGTRYAGRLTSQVAGRIEALLNFDRPSVDGWGFTISLENAALTASGFPLIVAAPACADGLPLLKTEPVIAVSKAQPGDGTLDLFTRELSMTLRLRFTFNSLRRADCAAGFFWTLQKTGASDPPLPLRLIGKISLSPAITADGRLRLGKIEVSETVTAQLSAFAYVKTCNVATTTPEALAKPAGSCDGVVGDDLAIASRLAPKTFTAELMIGNV